MRDEGYTWDGEDVILWLRVQPRAHRDRWGELRENRFCIRITAPPVDGKANAHLREFLATLFGVAKSRVTLLAGETGCSKRLRISSPKRLPPGITRPSSLS
ncbi:MAG: YggU family protein [Candidatus Contendobacter odensis]|uniref:UPF0235 protein CSA09_03235 n=1 Tax=Candidatus Contendibacter odensensis TaxID=1400860 RepID=A0A2G6PG10_9GAMM|nr:MAG: YggU family protein [Candidatus Contendobacter odensis]